MRCQVTLNTDGGRLWSDIVRPVTVTRPVMPYINSEQDFAELRAYFDTKTWDVDRDGLIYTDRTWIREFRSQLELWSFPSSDVDYSEQGMQGDDYVSMDCGIEFISAWLAKTELTLP